MSVFKMKDKPHDKPKVRFIAMHGQTIEVPVEPYGRKGDGLRKKPWCCEYRNLLGQKRRRYFASKPEAVEFQEENNSHRRRTGSGLPSTIEGLKKYTARDIMHQYMTGGRQSQFRDAIDKDELFEGSVVPSNDYDVLWRFSQRPICGLNLFQFNGQIAEHYKETRLKEDYRINNTDIWKATTARTVKREIVKIQQAWKWAKKNIPGLDLLPNPWEGIIVPDSTGGWRDRALEEGELEKILHACKRCLDLNKLYVPIAIHLAIETGMRRQEVFNLTWEDIDFKKRRITIKKSKTSKKPVDIVLPFASQMLLYRLKSTLVSKGMSKFTLPDVRIIPIRGETFTQTFRIVTARAGIKDLRFHDLRRTANNGFIKAELTQQEQNIMLRHVDKENKSNGRYSNHRETFLPKILDKLDRHILGGKTQQEMITQFLATEASINTSPPS